jgi:DNA topoisomerase-1
MVRENWAGRDGRRGGGHGGQSWEAINLIHAVSFLPTCADMATRWLRRLGTKRTGFRYAGEMGRVVRDRRTLQRVDALRIPPAWRDVRVAASPRSNIQAWGYDARGRKQYRYHDKAVERRELRKYYRMRELAKSLPKMRAVLRQDAAHRELSRQTVAAIVLRLISESFCRVGGERYARENGTYGITTLRKKHVSIENGCAVLSYLGKSNKKQRQVVVNPELTKLIARQLKAPGARLFRYRSANGEWCDLTARDVNNYVHERLGPRYSAKDFRTWGGTLRAATVLAELGPARNEREAKRNVALAMRLVSSELGNTPAICRSSYVHPIIIARYLDDGDAIALPAARRHANDRGQAHSPEERSLIAFLDRHFPDRRRRPRDDDEANERHAA